jgi:secreted trypsin-like serine protease
MWKTYFVLFAIIAYSSVNCELGLSLISQLMGSSYEEENNVGQSKIVGGETSPVNYPYQVSLQMESRGGAGFFFFQQRSNYSHFCGGSILNAKYIVTAAHWYKNHFITKNLNIILSKHSRLQYQSNVSVCWRK